MKMGLEEIDEQINEVQNRLAAERVAFKGDVHDCTSSLKQTLTSPKTLLALLGVGYAVGKVVFRDKQSPQTAAPAKKAGVLGLLTGIAGTALSMSGSRLGWGGVARWAAGRYFARRKAARAAEGTPVATPYTTVSTDVTSAAVPSSPPMSTSMYNRTPPMGKR